MLETPAIAALVVADDHYLWRAINNVLENAILYTPERGRVTISLYLDAGNFVIAIKDTGPGIEPSKIPYIFDRFYRGDEARTMTGGNGLGLAITKKIIDLHRGKIAVESVLGTGTKITITLPISSVDPGHM